jgi:hypothetical protein
LDETQRVALFKPAPTTELAVIWRPDDENPALHRFLEIIWEVAEIKDPQQKTRGVQAAAARKYK